MLEIEATVMGHLFDRLFGLGYSELGELGYRLDLLSHLALSSFTHSFIQILLPYGKIGPIRKIGKALLV
jgi:hypothetical protein